MPRPGCQQVDRGRGLHDDSGGIPSGYLAGLAVTVDEVHLTELQRRGPHFHQGIRIGGERFGDVGQTQVCRRVGVVDHRSDASCELQAAPVIPGPCTPAGYADTRGRQYGDRVATHPVDAHQGGGFNPPIPTTRGGPDYGRFVEAVRTLQDHARAVDAPDDVITEAAGLIEAVSKLLAPYDADEWCSPSGRRMDLPNRGNILQVPVNLATTAEGGRVGGVAQFRRFHLGRNGAVHGGAIAMLFDSVLGYSAFKLSKSRYQRTAFLHVNYRRIVPIEKELQVDAGIDRIDGRKIFVAGRLLDGEAVLVEAEALFVRLRPGQP